MKKELGPYRPYPSLAFVVSCFLAWTIGWTMRDHVDESAELRHGKVQAGRLTW